MYERQTSNPLSIKSFPLRNSPPQSPQMLDEFLEFAKKYPNGAKGAPFVVIFSER
jgi:hypothetical protein